MFIDYAEITVKSGKGGDGAVAFRREKYVPKGGPAGGNGGTGGNVIISADHNLHTLLDFKYNRKYSAEDGAPGGTSLKDGKNGEDVIIKVPVGTIIKDKITGEILFDFKDENSSLVIAKGGKGGKGNSNFATATNQAPRFAEDGKPGEEKNIVLELKLIADVGLVGFPNAGKSTFISSVSAARPKIADYPFTTLKPNLGIVNYKNHQSITVADIPGIIEGAHEGKGLGLQFLRHIERTKILLILIEAITEDIQDQYNTLMNELKNYSEVLSKKKMIVAISKIDLLPEDELNKLKKKKLINYSGEIYYLSSVTKQGIEKILDVLWNMLSD
ncbi:MAG: GTPase ObgE [Melioribacteraceae bacterium]|nr:GTPase ObgE [Melioribacteraceae bacterium]MDD3557984.1 GTPase ObgE [Melioribacteraceae bacterium]